MPRMPPLANIRVVRSSINGYGIVATRTLQPGDTIAEVEGIVWYEHEHLDDRYSLEIREGVFMDMVDQTRWINHSCEPNASVRKGEDASGTFWARFVALVPLAAGQEITFDYAFPARYAEPCHCGAATCRGYIVDADELHLVAAAAPH